MAEHGKLRMCGLCHTWNSKPCGEQCGWSANSPAWENQPSALAQDAGGKIHEALQLAYVELKKHAADYHHRTSAEINNKIVDALALRTPAEGDGETAEQWRHAYFQQRTELMHLRAQVTELRSKLESANTPLWDAPELKPRAGRPE